MTPSKARAAAPLETLEPPAEAPPPAKKANGATAAAPVAKAIPIKPPAPAGALGIPMQDASMDIWDRKYRLKTKSGRPVDATLDDTYQRVARALAAVEENDREHWAGQFLWALQNGAIPAGRIMSNAGALAHKPATSTINCTVSGTVHDSMDGILTSVHEAGMTLKAGCGIGYEFSTLRPRGAFVSGAGAHTSGPLSFMDIFNAMCFTVSSAGGRRGAQMATFDISHPDVEDFIRAKRENGRLRQFNMSCLVTDEFLFAVRDKAPWKLVFPAAAHEIEDGKCEIVWRRWPRHHHGNGAGDAYTTDEHGRVACRVYRTIPAERLWNLIMNSTYDYAEPGFILVDRINEMNNNWFCEKIRATNPCGEQPLPPYGSCLLGSVNLTCFVKNPLTENARFDWDKYRKVVACFTRMLDNVVEINGLPLPRQVDEIRRKRRHGMGFLGLGSTLAMLRMKYGGDDSLVFTERAAREMAEVGWETGVRLAREKGPAPVLAEEFTVTAEMLSLRPEMAADGVKVGDKLRGAELLARYSRYMQKFPRQLTEKIARHGCRFTHHTSIAPTGTISLSLANNASNGIEPSFAHRYHRNVIREGRKSKEKVEVFSCEFLAYRTLVDGEADTDSLPDYFATAADIAPRRHVDIQAAAQAWVDSSISKTINVPTDFDYAEFKDVYLHAHQQGLKGCTTFRYNPQAFQGVLVKDQDLKKTFYSFTLDNGETVRLRGDEEVEYDGEVHTAANLYDALKEGYYGKF